MYFGTDFDRSVELPDGFEMMLKICRYIDPVVRTSLSKDDKPWILSPLVSSINTMSAWRPNEVKLPSPPLTPRPSVDITRSFSMTDNAVTGAVSNAWGFLGKLKRGNRASVIGFSNPSKQDSSNSLNNYNSTKSASSDQVDKTALQTEGIQSITSPSTPQPGSLASSATSADWAAETETSKFNDEGMPLGPWRQQVDEDTTFFLPDKASLTTAQRRKHFQSEENRKDFTFKTDVVHGFEFFSPHMDFNTFDIRLGLSMNVRKYLAGQPVRYICRTLDGETVFWAVQFELVD